MKSLFIPLFLCVIISLLSCVSKNDKSITEALSNSTSLPTDTLKVELIDWIMGLKKKSQKFRDKGEPEKALIPLNTCIDDLWKPAKTTEEYKQLGWAYVNRAYIHEQHLGNYLQAKHDYLAALSLFHKANYQDFYVAAYVIQPLGNIHTRLGENEQALIMLTKFKAIAIQNNEIDAITNSYNDISRVYLNKNDYPKAIETLFKGLEIKSQNKINVGLLHSSLAESYLFNNQLDLGIEQSRLSKSHFLNALKSIDSSDYQFDLVQKYLQEIKKTEGNLLVKKGEFNLALSSFNESLINGKKIFPRKHRELGKIHLGLATCHINSGNINEGINSYQNLLVAMIPNFESYSSQHNPKTNDLYADVTIGEALIGKAKAQKNLYRAEKKIKFLKASLDTYLTYFNWEKTLRKEHQNDDSKLKFAAINHQVGAEALQIVAILNKKEPSGNWAEIGFKLIDQTKSIVLDQTRRRNIKQSKLDLKDSIFDELRQIEVQLSLLNIESNDALLANDITEQKKINKQIENFDEKYQILNHSIRQKYPDFTGSNSIEFESIKINALKDHLNDYETSILNYFEGDSSIYVAILDKSKTFFVQLDINNYKIECDNFIEAINTNNINGPVQFENTSLSLYKAIIAPIENQVNTKKWLIIPDGRMHQIPFEALIHSRSETKNFKQLNYLLHQHVISYCPSASFYLAENITKKALKPFLGIAPTFKNDNEFSWLNHSLNEVKIGETLFDGDILVSEKATKQRFLKKVEDYQIVHISTHANKGTNKNNDGWMAFTTDSLSNRLHTPEIFQLNLSSDLVILNACETGAGELLKGEGARSMTTGFLSSGANNVVTNLWQANHSSNLKLIEGFYETLATENKPSISLQQAKINFISDENTNELSAHPYYWAAPILIGTDKSIIFEESLSYTFVWYLLILPIPLLLFLTLRKNKIRQ